MINKLIRTIIGLPFIIIMFLFSRFIFGSTTLLMKLLEFVENGEIETKYDTHGLPINPYQFLKKVWT